MDTLQYMVSTLLFLVGCIGLINLQNCSHTYTYTQRVYLHVDTMHSPSKISDILQSRCTIQRPSPTKYVMSASWEIALFQAQTHQPLGHNVWHVHVGRLPGQQDRGYRLGYFLLCAMFSMKEMNIPAIRYSNGDLICRVVYILMKSFLTLWTPSLL